MDDSASRRTMLQTLALLWGGATLGFAVPLLRYFTAALAMDSEGKGSSVRIPLGTLTLSEEWSPLPLRIERGDAWHRDAVQEQMAYVRQRAEGNPEVLSAVCTHLHCTVHWEPQAREFACPCHKGRYDAEGKVVSGPPPRDLAALPAVIDGDALVVTLPSSEGA